MTDDPLDNPIEPGVVYCERDAGTWTVVENVYVSEDGETQVRIHDRLFPEPGRARVDCWKTPETKRLTITKGELIERVVEGDLRFMHDSGEDLDIGENDV